MAVYDAVAAAFWTSVAFMLYVYVAYPAALMLASLVVRRPVAKADVEPPVTLMVTAHDEETSIDAKMRNCLELDYPPEKLQVLVTSDGSRDETPDRILRYAQAAGGRIEPVVISERQGKMGAIEAAFPKARGDIIVFSDATSLYRKDAVKALVRNFADPDVGGVCGVIRLTGATDARSPFAGEGAYLKYETFLRRLESRLGSTIVASGAIYAIRRELFAWPPKDTVADDLAVTLGVLREGRRMVLEEGAVTQERASATLAEEFARKARTVAGGMQVLARNKSMLSLANGLVGVELVSHKLFRWLVPFAMVAALFTNALLASKGWLYAATFAAQSVFYGLALCGAVRVFARGFTARVASLAFHFCAANAAVVAGWWRFISGSQPAAWDNKS